ncbi:MAG: hypothetical protein CV087_24210 [Candidatus Brocadia sp. WS118]|nr:MAG: hypothetical protein CV087_24210 [Candidatus Brocadia sp. WS118]
MTWKDLQKLIQSSSSLSTGLDRLQGLPFWIWSKEEHILKHSQNKGLCCWNHAIGLPTKNGKEKPLFDYQKTILDSLQQYRHIFILKATGLGISELFLRYMAYLAISNNDYQNSQMVIVTGPNLDLATKLIKRMKNLFSPLLYFDSKETVLELNRCRIEAYPSNHIDSFRSLDNPKFILLDECDFFRQSEADEVRALAERYIGKSNPYIVLVSTPNRPNGLMQKIEQEQNSLYHKIKLDYRYGLGKIYTDEDITKAKQSPSFDREYDLKYLGKIGNVFSSADIDKAIENGTKYTGQKINNYCLHCCGIDWGFGSSKTVAYVCEISEEDQNIRIIRGKEWDHGTPSQIADEIFLWTEEIKNMWFFVDGSNRGAVNELKRLFNEDLEWERSDDVSPNNNKVIPVNFNKENRNMLFHAYTLLTKGNIAISPRYEKLILSLRSAQAQDLSLDKDSSPENDHLDAFRLMLKGVKLETDS